MLRVFRALCVLIVFAAADTSFAAPRKKTAQAALSKKGAKKARKLLIEQSRKKPGEKPAIESPPPAVEPRKRREAVDMGDPGWTDPLALRDALFLSTAARRARVEAGVIEEEKRDGTK